MKNKSYKYTILSFDVEEWFQVENLRGAINRSSWDSQNSTVVKNCDLILNLLSDFNVPATFFILGWIAERHPDLIKRISDHGHEVASHGFGHKMTNELTDSELVDDIKRSKNVLEEILQQEIMGYRAPNFSVSDRVIDSLIKLNFIYDSSYNPFQLHNRYGSVSNPQNHTYKIGDGLYEIPVSTVMMWNRQFPIGGGAYFRILPLVVFKNLIRKRLRYNNLYIMYLHPWEFEPEQEHVESLPLNYKVRHYTGLHKTERKLRKLIEFLKKSDCKFLTCAQYINQIGNP